MSFDGPAKPYLKEQQLSRGPKKQHRKVAGKKRWEQIAAAKLTDCLVCRWLGLKQRLPSTLHHIVPRSQGGADTESNVASVCGDGTRGHHGLIEAHHQATCQAFAAALQQYDDAAYSYAVANLGEDRFLLRYHVRFGAAA